MSLLWEHESKGTHYCVRNAGHSIRLYSNGVFHSQWNPNKPFAGAIWDCLSLPVLYRQPGMTKRVLLLGLGGGAGVRQLQQLIEFDALTAIEIDPIHIRIAKRWFDVNQNNVEIIESDAIDWLQHYTGPAFDYIIDDVFGHEEGEPVRVKALKHGWVSLLSRALSPSGVLVVNCISGAELQRSVPIFRQQQYVQGYRWSIPEYENAIGVFMREPAAASAWMQNLNESKLSPAMRKQARYVVRRSLGLS